MRVCVRLLCAFYWLTLFSLDNKNHALVKFAAKKLEFLTIGDSFYYDTLKKECNTEESKPAIKTQLQRARAHSFIGHKIFLIIPCLCALKSWRCPLLRDSGFLCSNTRNLKYFDEKFSARAINSYHLHVLYLADY